MTTRAELQIELRELMKGSGFGRLPVSTLNKSDLQAYVISMREIKAKHAEHRPNIPDAKRGPSGPRPIPVQDEEVEEEVIRVPGQPPAKLLVAPKVPVIKGKKPPMPGKFGSEDLPPLILPPKAELPPKKLHPGHFVKAEKPKKTVSITEPVPGKSGAVKYCPCSCPECPHRRS